MGKGEGDLNVANVETSKASVANTQLRIGTGYWQHFHIGNIGKPSPKLDLFVYVGRLSPEKGVETLIEAWRLMGRDAPPLLIIGDGDSRSRYGQLAEGLPITFLGQRKHTEVMDIVASAKAVIQPSVCWETFGLTVIEAATMGTPAIVSDLGALPDMVQDGRLGEVFEAGNADSLADAVKRILSRTAYTELCAAAQREAEEKYSESANYTRLLDIYAEATA